MMIINEIVSKDIYIPNGDISPTKSESRRKFNSSFIELGDLSQLKNKNFKNDQSSLMMSIKEESHIEDLKASRNQGKNWNLIRIRS